MDTQITSQTLIMYTLKLNQVISFHSVELIREPIPKKCIPFNAPLCCLVPVLAVIDLAAETKCGSQSMDKWLIGLRPPYKGL